MGYINQIDDLPVGWAMPWEVRRERAVRRGLKRLGFTLIGDCMRTWDQHFQGGYMVIFGPDVAFGENYGASLAECEQFLQQVGGSPDFDSAASGAGDEGRKLTDSDIVEMLGQFYGDND